jgi:hypothetical protein
MPAETGLPTLEEHPMSTVNLDAMSEHYRRIRRAVYQEATRPRHESPDGYARNQQLLRDAFTQICDDANLERYRGSDGGAAYRIWHQMWTKIRYAGFRAVTASQEIRDIEPIFDQFDVFSSAGWDVESNGETLICAGPDARAFLERAGPFAGKRTVRKISKLQKHVGVARKLHDFMDRKAPSTPVLQFVTGGRSEDDVWSIHEHLMDIGYTADLTALHFMMDIGFPVMKPDVIITRLFLEWGWLHQIVEGLPSDCTAKDLVGKGSHKRRWLYTNATVYKPVIDLARRIVAHTSQEELQADIGWVMSNPLREFDIFVVTYGQEPDPICGVVRKLAKWSDKYASTAKC